LGYVHQLDVLGDGEGCDVLERLRPLSEFPPHLPVDRALARLRAAGQRVASVGTREAPRGIVTL
jgi:CBS domain containing-hemolysin-like protein